MKFELTPIIETMLTFYTKPRSQERFHEYISILEGGKKGELTLPIGGFNPMAKEHIIEKLTELKSQKAEQLMRDTLADVNTKLKNELGDKTFKVVLNLADDLKGGWTNRFTTDYDSKFKINALVTRNFCTPFFWTSENYTCKLIETRTAEYVFRTLHWAKNPKPKSLEDHINQEMYVAANRGANSQSPNFKGFEILNAIFEQNQHSEDYGMIFNFLYGDNASKSLGFATCGITCEANGFDYARMIHAGINGIPEQQPRKR